MTFSSLKMNNRLFFAFVYVKGLPMFGLQYKKFICWISRDSVFGGRHEVLSKTMSLFDWIYFSAFIILKKLSSKAAITHYL